MFDITVFQKTFDHHGGIDKTPLEDLLAVLSLYGKPRTGVFGSDGTWHCVVDVYVSGAGVSFEVKSEFKHTSPRSAAIQCVERLQEALSSIGPSKKELTVND